MNPQTLISVGFAIAAVFLFWTLSSTTTSPFARTFPRISNKRICLLIAHPDDEAMFFAPTLLALTKPELGNHVKILCLSSGDADGLGHIRKHELTKSALRLGIRSPSDVLVLDEDRFRDSITTEWAKSDVAALLASTFAPDSNTSTKRTKSNATTGPTATIDVLLTFDVAGISNHPNHRSLYHGALHFLHNLTKSYPGYASPVALYTLTTTNMLRKYMGILDAPVTMVSGVFEGLFSSSKGRKAGVTKGKDRLPARLLYVSSVGEWMTAQAAMVKAHQSQMVWFRWGWISIGRYMAVNDLRREG
ncbi:putative deacetylase LmbE-like domain-containing protein [Aspergillus granulosus]|uniref:N-acetylglucosaminylphosphatidylinositol deacetylase n=1 Tax=Aspergillus granulosus TaxID=176169 RepID=A0ABR4I1B6_9EURO